MTQLLCEGINLYYGNNHAVEDVTFDLQAGDYLCVVGENGSGKSTLFKGILGLIPLKSGSIRFGGGVCANEIGYLPQQTMVQRDFPASVREVILSGCLSRRGLRPFYTRQDQARAYENMQRLNITHLKKECYRNLSGGQQQRVLLARALCATQAMLFLDEPISGLDPAMTHDLYELVKELNAQGLTIVMTSHDLQASVQYANKIMHIDHKMLFYGEPAAYIESDVSKKFLGGHSTWNC